MTTASHFGVQPLQWTGNTLRILDQRYLPDRVDYHDYRDAAGVAEAITSMQVRGAPAIGIAAAYGVALSALQHGSQSKDGWQSAVLADIAVLAKSRPTAVNLFWALERMKEVILQQPADLVAALVARAQSIHSDDIAANLKMGELGADIIVGAKGVLTHCNTGALATGGHGTALGVIRSAYKRQPMQVFAGETRPWLQGQRLTVWELAQDQIPVTLIADSAAAWLMQSGAIDWVIVGADRIARNGDTANKIGTYSLAVIARQHGVKVMVVAPVSTIDKDTASGKQIEIEQRQASELLPGIYQNNPCISAWNPVFDVTPASLITAVVTESGVVINPEGKGVDSLLAE
jgi:methylthioribose-1-phosphate isomerase